MGVRKRRRKGRVEKNVTIKNPSGRGWRALGEVHARDLHTGNREEREEKTPWARSWETTRRWRTVPNNEFDRMSLGEKRRARLF